MLTLCEIFSFKKCGAEFTSLESLEEHQINCKVEYVISINKMMFLTTKAQAKHS